MTATAAKSETSGKWAARTTNSLRIPFGCPPVYHKSY